MSEIEPLLAVFLTVFDTDKIDKTVTFRPVLSGVLTKMSVFTVF